MLFAFARPRRLPQEAVIGIVYAVSASLGVLALDRAPQGAEHIKQLLIGSILTVTPRKWGRSPCSMPDRRPAFPLRRPLIEVSLEPQRAAAPGGGCSSGTWCSTAPLRWS